MIGSLVAYKGKPARIANQTVQKFELVFSDQTTRKVREKDFRTIYPEFSKIKQTCPKINLSILNDLEDELVSLKELTEWLFDEYSAQNAWCSFLLAEDSLYCYWQKDKVCIRPRSQVEAIKNKRNTQAIEALNLTRCADNIKNNKISTEDETYLQQIEKVGLCQSRHAKILTKLGMQNTAEAAHALLLKLNYWKPEFNPYPTRYQILPDQNIDVVNTQIDRIDLTHLPAFAIDNSDSADADDAVSIEGDKIWIHIADVATLVSADTQLDDYAQQRVSNLYLPNETIHMLPPSLTAICALGSAPKSNALSISFSLIDNQVSSIELMYSVISVKKMSYVEVDSIITKHSHFIQLEQLTKQHKEYRNAKGAIRLDMPNVEVRYKNSKVTIQTQHLSRSREMVAELMIIAGRVIARFAIEHDIAMPYVCQEPGSFDEQTLKNKNSLTLSQSFQAMKHFQRSKLLTEPCAHSGLGLNAYLRVTSPLRRYPDLLAHQQLVFFLNKKKTLSAAQIKQRIKKINLLTGNINRAIRHSNDHFKSLYFMQNPNWRGTGIVVEKKSNKALVIIPSVGITTPIKPVSDIQLDSEVQLALSDVNLVHCLVDFKPI